MKSAEIMPVRHPQKMISYWLKEWRLVLLIVFFGISFNGAVSIGPILQGQLIDALAQGDPFAVVMAKTGFFLAVLTLIQALRYGKRYYVRRFANRTQVTMRAMMYNSLLSEERSVLERENVGELISKAVQDVDLCVEGMRKGTTEVFDTGVLMISYFVALLGYDVKMTLLAGAFIPLSMILAEKMKKTVVRINRQARNQSAQVAAMAIDQAEHAALYRILGQEKHNFKAFDRQLTKLEKEMSTAEVLENAMQPLYNAIALSGILVILTIGTQKVLEGTFSVGDFSAVMTMFSALALKASKASKLFNSFQKASVSWKRIQPTLKEAVSYSGEAAAAGPVYKLEIRDLTFGYPNQKKLIEKLSFTAHAGEIIGITGPIACGKSTLGRLLEGSLPYEGAILLDGAELSHIDSAKRARLVVRQAHDPQLFSWTIEENIRLDCSGELSLALTQAAFQPDLKTLPQREKTPVGNAGSALSGGQQARIALARTLYRKNPVMILDDPFSAVDRATEQFLIDRLRNDFPNSIIFVISHRLASFDRFDRVLLFQSDGTFLYQTHDELMKISPLYQALTAHRVMKEEP